MSSYPDNWSKALKYSLAKKCIGMEFVDWYALTIFWGTMAACAALIIIVAIWG